LEQSGRWGGKVQTEQVKLWDKRFIHDSGADGFLTRKPWAVELAHQLGLIERILPVNAENSRTFVLHRGKPVPLPDGLQLLVPTRLLSFLRSPLFSTWGKLRVGMEMLIPPRRSESDETLADFIRRRLGKEMLDKLGDLCWGVYNADRVAICWRFPQFPARKTAW
jgi:oxygen-dependent protoporphyrinogen oxidase